MSTCIKCGRERGKNYMQEAVFRGRVEDEPAGVWRCATAGTCRQERKKRRREDNRGGRAWGPA